MIYKNGYSLMELIIVLLLIGVMGSVVTISIFKLIDKQREKETEYELNQWKIFCVGNPENKNGNIRIDFGYFGKMGSYNFTLSQLASAALFSDDMLYDGWGNSYNIGNISGKLMIYSSKDSVTLLSDVTKFNSNKIQGIITDKEGRSINKSDYTKYIVTAKSIYPTNPKYHTPYSITVQEDGSFIINNVIMGTYEVKCTYNNSISVYNYCYVENGKESFVSFIFDVLPNTSKP